MVAATAVKFGKRRAHALAEIQLGKYPRKERRFSNGERERERKRKAREHVVNDVREKPRTRRWGWKYFAAGSLIHPAYPRLLFLGREKYAGAR